MADQSQIIADIEFPCVSGTGTHYTTDGDRFYVDPTSGNVYKGYCWKICPYSTQWYDKYTKNGFYRRVQMTDAYTKRFIQVEVPHTDQTVHTLTSGRMRYHQVGSRAGFLCDDPDCKYLSTYGQKFFEV
jgi:hypothetical protein